ncbi:hypothetical protein N7463_001574 [Penicillium fimorum]|uniref:Uncharacterized protein n=1 Tax=Penicillium fimorum TaxID=1882269 RepID=A0A9W9Y6N6_9EURO|nr:hypothetical protein N7463_001574 [Penicillium fimorum]
MAFPANDEEVWKSAEDNGNDPIYVDSVLVPESIKRWKVDSPPNNTKQHFDLTIGRMWRPKNVRLCDAGVVYALLALPTSYRAKHLACDFDARREVRTSRWLSASDYDKDASRLVAGLVVAPPRLKTDDNLNTDLTEYDPPQMAASAKVKDIWKFGHKSFNVRLCGTRQWENRCLILSNRKTGYQTMHKLDGINRMIRGRSPNAADFESFCMPIQYPARTDSNWDPVEQTKIIQIHWDRIPDVGRKRKITTPPLINPSDTGDHNESPASK